MKLLYHERDVVSANGSATGNAIHSLFDKMRENLNKRESALLHTVQKYTDIKLTKLDNHYQKLESDRSAIVKVLGTIEAMLKDTENTNVLVERQAICEELDLHQQSILSMSESPEDFTQSNTFLVFKEDHSLQYPISELGILSECRREANSLFLTVRRVVVTEDEDPYLDVPLRFEDGDSSGKSQQTDKEEPSLTSGLTEESCYDFPRPLSPQPKIELPKLPPKPKSEASLTPSISKGTAPPLPPKPTYCSRKPIQQEYPLPPLHGPKPVHSPKPFPRAANSSPGSLKLPQCSPETPGTNDLLALNIPPNASRLPVHQKIPPRNPRKYYSSDGSDVYDIPRPLEQLDTYDVPRRSETSETYDIPRRSTIETHDTPHPHRHLRTQRSLPDHHCVTDNGSDEDSYEPVIDIAPVAKPRKKPPPLPPNHPSKQEKPVPRPRLGTVHASKSCFDVTAGIKVRSRTFPVGISTPLLPVQPEKAELLPPVSIIGKDVLCMGLSHECVYPKGVYCMSDDTLAVTDVFNHCLRLVDTHGKFAKKIGREGRGGGQFKEPSAVVVTPEDHILVAERDNPRVQKFSAAGKYIFKFGQKALWGSQLSDPLGLAVSLDGNIYVSDWDKNAILVFTKTGKLKFTIDTKDSGPWFPAGIAFDKQGRLLVVDRKIHCVWILTPDGEYVGAIGSMGTQPGCLYYPYGIAVNSEGNIIVTESGNNRISVFSPTGIILECFGNLGTEPGMFDHPRHVCVNSKDQVIVADEMNQRLQVFDI